MEIPEPAPPPEKKDDPAVRVLLLMIMTAAMIAVVAVGEFALRSGLVRFAVLGVSLLLYAIGVSLVLYKLGGAPERWLHEFRRRTHPMPGQETLSHSLESGDQWKRAAFIADLRSLVGESLALSKRWSPGDLDRAMVGAAEELAAKPWTRQFLVNTSDVGHATAVYSIYGPEGLMDLVEGTVAESRTAQ